MTTRLWSVVFDASDHVALAKFWSTALGWRYDESDGFVTVRSDDALHPRLEFVPAPTPKVAKNRLHIDLVTESTTAQAARVRGLLELGATHADIGQHDVAWNVLADPEGNEFCVSGKLDYGEIETGAIAGFSFDGADPPAQGRFWSAATGWDIVLEGDWGVGLRSPDGTGPFLTIWPTTDPKLGKNRLHFDVRPEADGDTGAEAERLISLGARRIDIGQGDVPWVVMADPEGNEFCMLTPG